MATKKFIIEVDGGRVECENCPFDGCKCSREPLSVLDCNKYNLATMKINTEDVTNEKILKEVIDWIEERYDTDYVGGDIVRMLKNRLKEGEK